MSDRMKNLVRIRGIQEKVARGAVSRAQADQQAALAAEREVWAALSHTSAQLHSVIDGAAMQMAQQHVRAGVSMARLRGAAAEASAERLQGEIATWSGTAQRLEAVERLADRTEERAAAEAAHAETNEMDDLTNARRLISGGR